MPNQPFVWNLEVPAQQAITAAQMAAAVAAAREQNQAENVRSVAMSNVARENAAQQRAITQAQVDQSNRALDQRERESMRNFEINKADLDERRKFDMGRVTAMDKKESDRATAERIKTQYATLAEMIQADPPPKTEWQQTLDSLGDALDPDTRNRLNSMWALTRNEMQTEADNAATIARQASDELNAEAKVNPLGVGKRKLDLLKTFSGTIMFDDKTGVFVPLIKPPRQDHPGVSGTQGRVVPISDIIGVRQQPPITQPQGQGFNPMTAARKAAKWIYDSVTGPRQPSAPFVPPTGAGY